MIRTMAVLAFAMLAGDAAAQDGALNVPLRDPWIPPSARKAKSASAPTVDARVMAEHKLRAAFAAADADGTGSITREQARAAGLGSIAGRFADIDRANHGRITFEEYKAFLRARGADFAP
jgi:hypothetical protein